jgi:hypothetical protein
MKDEATQEVRLCEVLSDGAVIGIEGLNRRLVVMVPAAKRPKPGYYVIESNTGASLFDDSGAPSKAGKWTGPMACMAEARERFPDFFKQSDALAAQQLDERKAAIAEDREMRRQEAEGMPMRNGRHAIAAGPAN